VLSGDPHVIDFYNTRFDLHTPGVYQLVKTQEVDAQTTVKHCGGRDLARLGGRIVGCNSLIQVKLNGGDHVVSMALDSAYRSSQVYIDGVAKSRRETIKLGPSTVYVRGKCTLVLHTPEFEFHMTGRIWNGKGRGSAYIDTTVRAKRLIGSVPGICRGNGVACSGFTRQEEQEELQLGSTNTGDEQEEQEEQDELQLSSSRRRRRRNRRHSRRRRARAVRRRRARAVRSYAECTNYRLGAAQAIPFKAAAAAPPVALPGFGTCSTPAACATATRGLTTCKISGWHSLVSERKGWALCPQTLVSTGGKTCSEHCKKFGLQCARAQDNVGGSCKLDKRHTRKSTGNNGCDQRWSNQVCECGKPCGTELLPGCYVKTPTNCPKQSFSAPDYTRDTWGEANRNAAKDKNACLVTRKKEYDSWCGSSDTTMKFVPGAVNTVHTVARRGCSRTSNLISRNKPASQVGEGWSGRPSRAVDGNSDGRYRSGSCTHTNRANRPWWKVDLKATYAVDKVVVWNRADCCASRLNNFEVLVDSQLCGKVRHARRSNTVSCHKKKGRSVTVRLAGRTYLTLCEVQVYGGTCSEEQEQLQLGSSVSATERCQQALCGISGLCTIPSRTVKDMIKNHVQECADDETAGFSDDMTLVKSTFCDALEDSIESTDLCPAAKLCVAAGLIEGTGSGYKAFC